jgi:DNA-binding transcriptional LysR family regulator
VDETRASFEQIEQSFAQVRDLAEQPSGLLRVTAPVALARQQIALQVFHIGIVPFEN